MSDYSTIRTYFSIFLGDDADAYGENYPEVVDSSLEYIGGVDEALITEIDRFLLEYPTNEQAVMALNNITEERHGDCAGYPPSLLEFMIWLSAYLKQKRDQ